mgnify:FL=1
MERDRSAPLRQIINISLQEALHPMTALEQTPVIPLIQSEAPEIAVQIAEALKAGGLTTLEVVW